MKRGKKGWEQMQREVWTDTGKVRLMAFSEQRRAMAGIVHFQIVSFAHGKKWVVWHGLLGKPHESPSYSVNETRQGGYTTPLDLPFILLSQTKPSKGGVPHLTRFQSTFFPNVGSYTKTYRDVPRVLVNVPPREYDFNR